MARSSHVDTKAFHPAHARFASAKTERPIPYRNAAVRDFLILSTLDPAVCLLAPSLPVEVRFDDQTIIHQPDAIVRYDDRICAVDVYSPIQIKARRAWFDAVGAALLAQGLSYDLREVPGSPFAPLVLNARTVWGCRNQEVPASDQVRVLQYLREAGAAPLIEVSDVVQGANSIAIILAMACRNLVELDLESAPLGPETPVRRRRSGT